MLLVGVLDVWSSGGYCGSYPTRRLTPMLTFLIDSLAVECETFAGRCWVHPLYRAERSRGFRRGPAIFGRAVNR